MARVTLGDLAINSRGEWCVAIEVSRDYSTTGRVRRLVPIGCPKEYTKFEALAAANQKEERNG